MRRPVTAGLSAVLVSGFLLASLWLTSSRPVLAQPPDRTPVSATQTAQAAAVPSVAAIALYAPGAPATAWTVVQWQDALGGWQDVVGWRGELDEGEQKVWWVLGKDFNTGPFRWVVFHDKASGQVWSISSSFTLPAGANQWAHVNVAP